MIGNSLREEWGVWSKLVGLGAALTVDSSWILAFASLTTPGIFAGKTTDVPLEGEELESKKAALLEKPPSGKRFVDLLTACVLQTHGLQAAKKKEKVPANSSTFVALSFTDSCSPVRVMNLFARHFPGKTRWVLLNPPRSPVVWWWLWRYLTPPPLPPCGAVWCGLVWWWVVLGLVLPALSPSLFCGGGCWV